MPAKFRACETKMTKTKTKRPITFFRGIALATLTLLLAVINIGQLTPKATAAAASTVNFQARLLTAAGAVVPDGTYNVEFKLYNTCTVVASSGGCTTFSGNVWTETRTTTNRVRVVNGYLTVNLGSVTAFSGVNWDQELWLTMRVGGTSSSPAWDDEMTPALKLTAVPYAFQAGGLANTNGANRSTLGWNLQTASNAIYLPNEGGTICIQNSANCGFLTSGGASGSFVQLQGSTPGTPQTGNLNISGTAIAGTRLQSPILNANTIDTISGTTTLEIGTTNATSGINLNQNTTLASGKTLSVQGTSTFKVDSHTAFQVLNAGNGQILGVDTLDNLVRVVNSTVINSTLASGTGALQIGIDAGDNLALDDNEIMARNNGSTSTLYVQKLGGGLQIQATSTTVKPASLGASTFQVQNTSSQRIFGVDTSSSQLLLGQGSTMTGKMAFYNSTNNNAVTIQSGTTTTSYALVLPTALGASGDCIKDTTGTGVLGFGACGTGGGGGGSTLQNSYDNSGTANPQILLNTTNGGIKIRDASGGVSGNMFQIQNAAGTAMYFGLSASSLTLQDTAGNNAFIFDTNSSHLRIYADGTGPTAFADIYYDGSSGEAVFTASTGATRIGSGTGNILLQLSNAGDVLQATKALSLSSAYSGNDFSFTRNITAAGNALTGSVVKIESTSNGSGTIASNILWVNEGTSSATGNLIVATKGGAGNEKFKVNVDGTVTIATGQSYTGAGALGVASTAGNLTLTAGGASSVIAKPGSNNAAAFQVQNASSTALFTADTSSNRLQVGSSTTDATAVLHVLDSYNQTADPTGVAGAMYYNTDLQKFRCFRTAWEDCQTSQTVYQASDSSFSSTALVDTDHSFSVAANTDYWLSCQIVYRTAAVTTGIRLTVNGPGTPTLVAGTMTGFTTGNTVGSYSINGYNNGGTSAAVPAANVNQVSNVEVLFRNGATAGTLTLRRATEVSTSLVTINAGSMCRLTQR